MNYFWIDPDVSTSGSGTLASPFKSLNDFFSLSSVTHPLTIYIKSGTSMTGGNVDTNNLLYNTTGEQSYIYPYGDSSLIPKIVQSGAENAALIIGKAKNISIYGIEFIGPFSPYALSSISPYRTSSDENANVWLVGCKWKAKAVFAQTWVPALWFTSVNDLGRVSSFGLRDCSFENTPRGVWIQGNGNMPSGQTTNIGDRYYGYGIRAENVSCVNVGGDGIIISNAASVSDPLSSIDATTSSGLFNCTYRSSRIDFQANASVPFWMSNCNKVVFDHLTVVNNYAARGGLDKCAYDFDILCQNCLIQYSTSNGCGGGFLLTSNYANQVPALPSGTDVYTWYYTNRFGNCDNTVRYCSSFNDGWGKQKIQWQGYTFNLNFHNVTFFDTFGIQSILCSMYRDSTNLYSVTNGVYGLVFDSCNIYSPNCTSSRVAGSDANSGTTALITISNFNIYGGPSVTPVIDSAIVQSSVTTTDPLYINCPSSSPSTSMQTAKIKFKPSSPLFSAGTPTTVADINGNSGSNIGWTQ